MGRGWDSGGKNDCTPVVVAGYRGGRVRTERVLETTREPTHSNISRKYELSKYYMNASLLKETLAVVLLVSAGCATFQPSDTPTTDEQVETTSEYGTTTDGAGTTEPTVVGGGKLLAYTASTPPENATVVNYTESRLGNATILTEVLGEAVRDGDAAVDVTRSELEPVDDALEDVPRHDGSEFGYYVRYDGTVVQLRVARY